MMNSQSCPTAVAFPPKPTTAGQMDRAGFTETPVTLMPTMWITTSVMPIATPDR